METFAPGGWSRGDGDSLGFVKFNDKTSLYYREKIEFPFFEYHLKGKGGFQRTKAWVFETGANVWRQHETWPPAVPDGDARDQREGHDADGL